MTLTLARPVLLAAKRFCTGGFFLLFSPTLLAADCAILLHGLARTPASLDRIADALEARDYQVINAGYPSRSDIIETLAGPAIEQGLAACESAAAEPVNFVTHSMGGILVRYFLEHNSIEGLHRVVMLAPPNQGSTVVDVFRQVPGYTLLNGPAGLQMGTGKDSVPLQLGPVEFELGVIAGNRTINLILSQFLENPDDGKVSVAATRVEGMCAFVELPVTHALMMRNDTVIEQVLSFLESGRFTEAGAENGLCGDE